MRLCILEHRDLPIRNNLSESRLRGPEVGGTEGGPEAAARWLSLIASCTMRGLDSEAHLGDLAGRLLVHESKRVHELPPPNWRLAVEARDFVRPHPGSLNGGRRQ